MCIDYRALNNSTIKNKFPLLLAEDLFGALKDAKVSSKMNFNTGFNQVRVHKQNRYDWYTQNCIQNMVRTIWVSRTATRATCHSIRSASIQICCGICPSLCGVTNNKRTTSKFVWSDQQQFDTLKRMLSKSPVLKIPGNRGKYRMTTDASGIAICAVLEQEGGQGSYKPIQKANLNKSELFCTWNGILE